MSLLALITALLLGFGIAGCITICNLRNSNELGNSKSSMRELGGKVKIIDKKNHVRRDFPV